MSSIIIKENRNELKNLIALGTIIVLLSLLILFKGVYNLNVIFIIVGIIGSIFFGYCYVFTIMKLIKPKPLIVVNNSGIIDNSTAVSIGVISWDNIIDFRIEKHFNNEYIAIYVNNLNSLIKALHPLKRIVIRLNIMFKFSPILIYIGCADISSEEILNILKKQLIKV
ncbi:hypothetical protein NX821_002558 [Clostridium septicum]|uniref:STM3941 family protein n=1 Tax=Clostridium septicum TaxID=1504 RepID=UPI00321744BA